MTDNEPMVNGVVFNGDCSFASPLPESMANEIRDVMVESLTAALGSIRITDPRGADLMQARTRLRTALLIAMVEGT